MGKFNWDDKKELAPPPNVKPSGKFNWDDQQEFKPKQDDKLDAAQAGLEHFGNAASFGYMPQVQGLVSQMMPDPNSAIDNQLKAQGFKIEQKKPTYVEDRDAYAKRLQEQEKNYPTASAIGTLGGAITSGIATSALTPINAATRMGRVAQAAKAGAVVGAISNPGDKEGEISPLQLSDRARGLATGAVVGGAFQGGIEGLSSAAKGITGLGTSLTGKAEERAFKSSGAMLKDYRAANGQDRINKIGRYMLDNGLVKPGMSVSDIAAASEKLQGEHGKAIGAILDGLDQGGAVAPGHNDLAATVESLAQPMKGIKTAQPTHDALQNVADDIRTMGVDASGNQVKPSFNSAQEVKSFIDDQIKSVGGWKAQNPSEKNLALRKAYGKVNELIENAADDAAKSFGDENLSKQYLQAKEGYRNASDVNKIATDKALRNNANNFFSIGDKIGAGTGFTAGFASGHDLEDRLKKGAQGAAAGYVANKVATHGTPLVSNVFDAIGSKLSSSALPKIGEALSPALEASEKSRLAPSMAEAVASSPKLEAAQLKVADSSKQTREPSADLKGEAKWHQDGIDKLGLDQSTADQLLGSKAGKQLLLEAHSLPANSKRLQTIKNQIQSRGNK